MELKPGWYWVRIYNRLEIAEYTQGGHWRVCGVESYFHLAPEVIGPRIEPPEEE